MCVASAAMSSAARSRPRSGLIPTQVCWRDFAWDNGHGSGDPINGLPKAIVFRTSDYLDVLTGVEEMVADLPYDQLADRERRFLWPWQWGWRSPKGE